jgi:hypothetical protein
MNTTYKNLLTTITLLLVLGFSIFVTPTVYADEATPEAPVEVTEATLPEGEEAALQATPEVVTESESVDLTESVESIIEALPEDTQLVVLDEAGEALPLASQEAEEAIIVGDPIWCPASVAVPTPGLNGCTASHATFVGLLADPVLNVVGLTGVGPTVDGIIWVEKTYAGEGSTITISGLTFTAMNDFKLTIKGGWNGIGTNTIDTNDKSVFNAPLIITGWNNDVTVSDIAVSGSTTATTNAFQVTTTGNITITRVSVDNNSNFNVGGNGAVLANSGASTPKNVTVTDSNFSNNTGAGTNGLQILSKGVVTLKNITANNNATSSTSSGIIINNASFTSTAQAVNLTNVSANNNRADGIFVNSNGIITITDMTATNNGISAGDGAEITNNNVGFSSGITLLGTNLFSNNYSMGLNATSNGAVKLNNIYALSNGSMGVFVDNDGSATPQAVSITGSSVFKFNGSYGLIVYSNGQITGNNLTANANGNTGAEFSNNTGPATSGVTLTGTNQFNGNANTSKGLTISSAGAVTLNNITASYNTSYGVSINNKFGTAFKGVTLTGVHTFDSNGDNGLNIESEGIVILNNITAKGNSGNHGVYVNNIDSGTSTPKAVTVNGTNLFIDNDRDGLYVNTYGAITLNNITATGNGFLGHGAYLVSNGGNAPGNVTLNGTNDFSENYGTGLYIFSNGQVKINNLTSNNSQTGYGADLSNVGGGAVTLTGTNKLEGNQISNLVIYSEGVVSINNLTANDSDAGEGVNINNSVALSAKAITFTGTTIANGNYYSGITLNSIGVVTINNLTANFNGASNMNGTGASITTTQNVTLTGSNSFNGNHTRGITITTAGSIKINNLTANSNDGSSAEGAYLDTYSGTNGSVTLTGSTNTNGNHGNNLVIYASGAVLINNLSAIISTTGGGAIIESLNDINAPKPVTLTGVNTFDSNSTLALKIDAYGIITVNNINASFNGAGNVFIAKVELDNSFADNTKPAAVIMKGTNNISQNQGTNLRIASKGAITTSNLTAANSSNSSGAILDNSTSPIFAAVSMTGNNDMSANGQTGLAVASKGAITVSNLLAFDNTSNGVLLNNLASGFAAPKSVTILGFADTSTNGLIGLEIRTYGTVVTNSINSVGNVTGASIDNVEPDSVSPMNITMNGVNNFSSNTAGLTIESLGNITLSNISAEDNTNYGASISATAMGAIGNVTLNGTNTFSSNGSTGLIITTNGTITTNNVTANSNAGVGAFLNNTYLGTSIAKVIKMTGTNEFSSNTMGGYGLQINTYGAVTLNNVTAIGNANIGVFISNNSADAPANVTFTGKNQMSYNTGTGLHVATKGNITISNLTANNNSSDGAFLKNDYVGATGKVTITGSNFFVDNTFDGLDIASNSTISLTKIVADSNAATGITAITTAGNINLTCVSATNNTSFGVTLNLPAPFVATIKGLIAAGNASALNQAGTGTYVQVYGYTCP